MTIDDLADSASTIPEEMRAERRWCVWRNKVPYHPNGQGAKSNDPDTWVTHQEAQAACEADDDIEGVGFMLGDEWAGVDLDGCIDSDGQLTSAAEETVSKLASYTEISPSGKGLHVFVRGTVPYKGGRKGTIGGSKIEVYGDGRYFTVTGDLYADSPNTVEAAQETLDDLLAQLGRAGALLPNPRCREAFRLRRRR